MRTLQLPGQAEVGPKNTFSLPSQLKEKSMRVKSRIGWSILYLVPLLLLGGASYSQSDVMGALKFDGSTKIEKSSGVWIDGKYVGYVSELKGHNKVMLLPGPHSILVRQAGYSDFKQDVTIQPGVSVVLIIKMQKDPSVQYSKTPAEIKVNVMPEEAGVFLDGQFVGYVHQFGGVRRAMLVNPGKHSIKVVLPGYEDFETQVDLLPRQKFTLSTKLVPGTSSAAGTPVSSE
jgi:hypothetical protein